MIRGYHVCKDVWLSYTGEVLYGHLNERSAKLPFTLSTSVKQNQNVYSLEILVKRCYNDITRHWTVTCAAITELKQW